MSSINLHTNQRGSISIKAVQKHATPLAVPPATNIPMYAERAEKAADKAVKALEEVKQLANGEAVTDVTEKNGAITIEKANGKSTNIKFIKTINGLYADDKGNLQLSPYIQVKFLGDSKV